MLYALVRSTFQKFFLNFKPIADSCTVSNGGCDSNAVCSHDGSTNAVVCTCKTGYTNTGSSSNVVCTGKTYILETPS